MTTLRTFTCEDLFRYNTVNLDPLTETYNLSFYLMYMSRFVESLGVSGTADSAITVNNQRRSAVNDFFSKSFFIGR